MIESLFFNSAWLLLSLTLLPLLWWLLKLIPPAPQNITFGAFRLLQNLKNNQTTQKSTPPLLLLLRLLLLISLIFGFANLVYKPAGTIPTPASVIMIFDNGWASAQESLEKAKKQASQTLSQFDQKQINRITLLTTANMENSSQKTNFSLIGKAQESLITLQSQAWEAEYLSVISTLEPDLKESLIYYFDDGIITTEEKKLWDFIDKTSNLFVYSVNFNSTKPLLTLSQSFDQNKPNRWRIQPNNQNIKTIDINILDNKNNLVYQEKVSLTSSEQGASFALNAPTDIQKKAKALRLNEQRHAAGIFHLEKQDRLSVFILGKKPTNTATGTYLDPAYYIETALTPFHKIQYASADQLLKLIKDTETVSNIDAIILPRYWPENSSDLQALNQWVEKGGILISFATDAIAGNTMRQLIPVSLRQNDRRLDGSFSWEEEQKIAPFPENSPFHTIDIKDDITIKKQVLAEPSLETASKTWATLLDGTPLITAETKKEGLSLFFHLAADPTWSNLPLSGLFVELLQRTLQLKGYDFSYDSSSTFDQPLELKKQLNASGLLQTVSQSRSVFIPNTKDYKASPKTPPGLYGNDQQEIMLNLSSSINNITYSSQSSWNKKLRPYEVSQDSFSFLPFFLLAALLFFFMETLLSAKYMKTSLSALILMGLLFLVPFTAQAQSLEKTPRELSNQFHLGFIKTGNEEIDTLSANGLKSLGYQTKVRTSVDVGGVSSIDLEQDSLAFYPLIYWPLQNQPAPLSSHAAQKLKDWFHAGGTLLIDTKDGYDKSNTLHPALILLGTQLDIPPLLPLPSDHVLNRSFYLLPDQPGLYKNNPLWISQTDKRKNDGVSAVIIGKNDWISAWATDPNNIPLFPIAKGGEQQREMAYRFGINLILYTLTGNYKDDQVHIPFIIERLGQ